MLRSFSSAVSGMESNQMYLDTVANNIANVNTTGFKAAHPVFQDLLSQTIRGGESVTPIRAGLNPFQIGLGSTLSGQVMDTSQGNLSPTGRPDDIAIQGTGFLIVSDGAQQFYTRDGRLGVDSSGRLVHEATGDLVVGWVAAGGKVNTSGVPGPIVVNTTFNAPTATTTEKIGGNLDASSPVNVTSGLTITVYDSLGSAHQMQLVFQKTAGNTWTMSVTPAEPGVTATLSSTSATFSTTGAYTGTNPITLTVNYPAGGGTTPQTITLDLSQVTQYSNSSSLSVTAQDGYTSGQLLSTSFGENGEIFGTYSNGQTQLLGQLALASFTNPDGLARMGGNIYQLTPASGTAQIGTANTGGRGSINPGDLEQSNVDLSQQFTQMITAQRGFEASSSVVRTANSILQSVINLAQ